ncbi:transmembrane protein, putative (macronuclear) [Tetrahymena thermophila SB210]|uniref:Transmembrane protein, putative n=1 Tax=Tetrahymena thermophila (strain SB210) TaxID=312017 RepID=Q240S5_TETTS|nr:transmembrane protein, putative [Tetrahymena thermophila SB210]EAS02339.1 transmembrane protein, putative [Tetrahymena thermophila SB210]|eukprot:XP_001022584.1 transmembrane protein, putative [Tetrahymena thermophila SB210]
MIKCYYKCKRKNILVPTIQTLNKQNTTLKRKLKICIFVINFSSTLIFNLEFSICRKQNLSYITLFKQQDVMKEIIA